MIPWVAFITDLITGATLSVHFWKRTSDDVFGAFDHKKLPKVGSCNYFFVLCTQVIVEDPSEN